MLETTIAGSLPKPAWLAKPRMLCAPWQLEGEALVEAKRATRLMMTGSRLWRISWQIVVSTFNSPPG